MLDTVKAGIKFGRSRSLLNYYMPVSSCTPVFGIACVLCPRNTVVKFSSGWQSSCLIYNKREGPYSILYIGELEGSYRQTSFFSILYIGELERSYRQTSGLPKT